MPRHCQLFVDQRHLVYRSMNEATIRLFWWSNGIELPEDQTLFWAYIYTAILIVCQHKKVVQPTEAKVIAEANRKLEANCDSYEWWMAHNRAKIWFECNRTFTPETHAKRFIYQGFLYALPECLWLI